MNVLMSTDDRKVGRRADGLHSQDPIDTFVAVWSLSGKNPIVTHVIEAEAIAEAGQLAMVDPGRKVLSVPGNQPSRSMR